MFQYVSGSGCHEFLLCRSPEFKFALCAGLFSFHSRVSCVGTKLHDNLHPSQHRKHKLQPWHMMNHGGSLIISNDTSTRASRKVLCIKTLTNGFDARLVIATFTTLNISVQSHTGLKSIGGEWSNVHPLLAVPLLAVLHLMQVL